MLILYIMWRLSILLEKSFCLSSTAPAFEPQCEMCWSCCVEIRNEEGWSLYGFRGAGTHKHTDCRHYEMRICQWISSRMCSLSQPDVTCQPLQALAPSNASSSMRRWEGGSRFAWNSSRVRDKCLIGIWTRLLKYSVVKMVPTTVLLIYNEREREQDDSVELLLRHYLNCGELFTCTARCACEKTRIYSIILWGRRGVFVHTCACSPPTERTLFLTSLCGDVRYIYIFYITCICRLSSM